MGAWLNGRSGPPVPLRAPADLLADRQLLELAERAADFGVWESDLLRDSTLMSAGAAALSGYPPAPTKKSGAELLELVHPDDRAAWVASLADASEHHSTFHVEFRVRQANGEYRWRRSRGRVDFADGKPVRMVGAVNDIHDEKALVDRLQESAERMRLAEEAAGFGVWESDRVAGTITVSEGMLRLHELPPDAPCSFTRAEIAALLDADYVSALKVAAQTAFRTGERCEIEVPLKSREGTTRWRRIVARPEYRNGTPWRLIGATLDVTGERQMRYSLEQARAKAEAAAHAKSEFLANMSHEIRTPLNGVIGMAQLLLDSGLSPQQRDWAETAMSSGDALLTIINDILDFSKIEAGKMAIDAVSFDLRRLLEEVAGILAPKAADKGVDLMVRYCPDTPVHLVGDASRIRQVVLNLANNAVKFTNAGYVLISAEAMEQDLSGAAIRLAVTDTGIGIPPHAMDTLFDKFTQADSSTTRRYGGTGLGLAISKRLVELMRGTIHVESQEGRGSTFAFTMRLPLGRHPDAAAPTPAALLRGTRALIVVDNVVNRRVIREQIADWGMRDGSAGSNAEALDVMHAAAHAGDPYQIVIADQEAPGIDGFELAGSLRHDESGRDVVFVMLTSIGGMLDEPCLKRQGVDACLAKPVRHSRLIGALSEAWAKRQGARPAPPPAPPQMGVAPPPPSKAKGRAVTGAAAGDASAAGRVLVVEDNPVNQKVAVALLSRLGVRADVAHDGAEAVERMRTGTYDLVLMDCQMPVMNGYDATIEIRRLEGARRVPILAMTADVIDGSRQRALEAGMDDFVAKPVDLEDLSRALRTWLRPAA